MNSVKIEDMNTDNNKWSKAGASVSRYWNRLWEQQNVHPSFTHLPVGWAAGVLHSSSEWLIWGIGGGASSLKEGEVGSPAPRGRCIIGSHRQRWVLLSRPVLQCLNLRVSRALSGDVMRRIAGATYSNRKIAQLSELAVEEWTSFTEQANYSAYSA